MIYFRSSAASQVHAELVSDIGYKVQAVLVEEDEEEDECEAAVDGAQTQPGAATGGTVEAEEREPEGEKMEEQEEEEEAKEEHGEEEQQQQEEEEETEGKNEEQLEEEKEDGEEVLEQDAEAALVEEEERMREEEEENIQTVGQVPAEPAESAVTGGGLLSSAVTQDARSSIYLIRGKKLNFKVRFIPKMSKNVLVDASSIDG